MSTPSSDLDLAARREAAIEVAEAAGALALDYFRNRDRLSVEAKRTPQDVVSEADREVELMIRDRLARAFPDDAFLGEEHGLAPGTSGLTCLVDPIDGTSPFLSGLPSWCVSIGAAIAGTPVIGVIHAPCHGETYAARQGGEATLNGAAIRVDEGHGIRDGLIGFGFNDHVPPAAAGAAVEAIAAEGGSFIRNGSGALMLAYVAAGRLIAYAEPRMAPWDCMAGYCLVASAGGRIRPYPYADGAFAVPAPVLAANRACYESVRDLLRLEDAAAWNKSAA